MNVPLGGVIVIVNVTGTPAVGFALGEIVIVGCGLPVTVTELFPEEKSPITSNAVAWTAYDPVTLYVWVIELGVPGNVWTGLPSPKFTTTRAIGCPFWLMV
jgi:hypothetical protein